MLRVLVFSTLYPNQAQPNHGVFVENRLRHTLAQGGIEATVLAPVPWFPFRHPRFRPLRHLCGGPASGNPARPGNSPSPLPRYPQDRQPLHPRLSLPRGQARPGPHGQTGGAEIRPDRRALFLSRRRGGGAAGPGIGYPAPDYRTGHRSHADTAIAARAGADPMGRRAGQRPDHRLRGSEGTGWWSWARRHRAW